ncbi:DUF2141 domain-containing protein [uncultured Polaribacter sp.]|uniref:DUF2141 domain-containing protein n=1 Tax=uncultured Polaribacter sp. TaxID=174711 RepID=UPI002611B9FE|nr:DUF2141 domain-containing protein [uncultured Polaribacter sp.]
MQKIILIIAIIFTGIFFANAQEQDNFTLTVKITNLNSNKGQILIALYKGDHNFLKKRFIGGMSKIKDNKVTYTFKNIPKGEYAVSFFHDKNNNGKLDTNFLGIPKEDYGCSNNAIGFMGAPKYKDAKFELNSHKTIENKF